MTNKYRERNGYEKRMGRYRLNRSDMLAIEKILRVYSDAREMKHVGVSKLLDGQKHMSRAVVDRYASIGRYLPFHLSFGWSELGIHYAGVDWIYREDSVKFLPKHIKKAHYVQLAAWPGITVTFTPLTTTIYAQTHYATGSELNIMKRVVHDIEKYMTKVARSNINICTFNV